MHVTPSESASVVKKLVRKLTFGSVVDDVTLHPVERLVSMCSNGTCDILQRGICGIHVECGHCRWTENESAVFNVKMYEMKQKRRLAGKERLAGMDRRSVERGSSYRSRQEP